MKPSGLAERKNSPSSGVSAAPAQPKMTARGWLIALRANDNAGDLAALELAAQPLGRGGVGDRRRLDAIIGAAVAEIGARPHGGQIAEQVAVPLADFLPFQTGSLPAPQGAELQAINAGGRQGGW